LNPETRTVNPGSRPGPERAETDALTASRLS